MSTRGGWKRLIERRSGREIEAEVDEELTYHLEQRIGELERRGFSAAEARAEALRRFGDVGATRAFCVAEDARRDGSLRRRDLWWDVVNDARMGVRQLQRRPGYAVGAIVTLAVAIGFATATYTVADHVLFRPLPFGNTARVVTLWQYDTKAGADREVAPGNFMDWRERVTLFEEFALAEPTARDLTGEAAPEALPGWGITAGWFEALGVEPLVGRLPEAAEYVLQSDVVLLSHGLWQRRFGGDETLVGRSIQLDDAAVTVIGILPPGLQYPADEAEIWVPMVLRESSRADRRSDYMRAIGLLKPDATLAQAEAELAAIAQWQAETYPQTNADHGIVVRPLTEQVLGVVRPALLTLLGAVVFVLLIACANVAGLLMARGTDRKRELSVRAALGGSRARLTRQLLIESAVLAAVSGCVGLLLARAIIEVIPVIAPPDLPRLDALRLDLRILGAAVACTCVVALLFGTAPALRAARTDLAASLRHTGVRGGDSLRRLLVAGEFALALVLLTGAGLMGRSFVRLLDNDLGFEPQDRASLQVFIWDRNPTTEQRIAAVQRVLERMRTLPEVIEAGATSALPVHPHAIVVHTSYRGIDEPMPPPGAERSVRLTAASPGYFVAMGMAVRAGRDFAVSDDARSVPVAIVSESFARAMFGEQSAVGRQLRLGADANARAVEIVGIVQDVRPAGFAVPAEPEVYLPHAQTGTGSVTFVVHTRVDAARALAPLRAVIWEEDSRQTIYHEATMEQLLATTLAERRFQLSLLGAFALLALSLAAVGCYALISYTTRLRVGEIGVRMALGARSTQIVAMIVRDGVRVALPGLLLGLAGSLALTRLIAGMLYDVSPTDPLTLAQVGLTMLLVAAAAAYVPARRAARLDPVRALRTDA